ncbi:MAG: radical SAM protein [Deltaproteobacteria bacterium]|nr:radical SAM protein [Deltaproteobacteria bacterium]
MTSPAPGSPAIGQVFSDSRKVSKFLAKADPLEILAAELGPRFADYRRRWDLARSFREIPPFPLHVDYELKSDCNLRCPMCPMAGRGMGPAGGPELSLPAVKALIDEGLAQGQASLGFGGLWEPLLSGDLPEIIGYGRERGLVEAMFNTNGLLLDERTGRDLIDSGLTRIMISLDAARPETYRLMRPGSDLGLVEDNILAFLGLRERAKSRLPLVRLSFCLTRHNQAELGPFLERWEDKVDFFSLQSYGRFGAEAPSLFPDHSPVPPPSGRCAQPFKRLLVRHDGQVLPCCDLSGLSLGLGLAGQGLARIWSGASLADLRRRLLGDSPGCFPEACQDCQSKFRPSPTA